MEPPRGLTALNVQDGPTFTKIFVYGTLKPGGRNYFLAKGVTHAKPAYVDGYNLLHFEPERYPAIVPGGGRVHGFVLTFADIGAALPVLDALEGLHLTPPEYARVTVTVQPSGEAVWAYVHVNQARLAAAGVIPVAEGDWPSAAFAVTATSDEQ